jgi:hypothetical protein
MSVWLTYKDSDREEISLGNSTFRTFMRTWGIDFPEDLCGELDPNILIDAILRTPIESHLKQSFETGGPGTGSPTMIYPGMSYLAASEISSDMFLLAVHAVDAGEEIFYS